MSARSYSLNQRGDSLVEVLIAMVIVAVVLGGAYRSSSNSFNATQSSKDRDIALRVAETQLERIRGFKLGSPSAPIANGSCMNSGLGIVSNGGGLPALAADNLNGAGIYSGACVVNHNSATYSAGRDVPYHIYNEVNGNDYTIHVRWPRAGGGQNQEATLRYRFY